MNQKKNKFQIKQQFLLKINRKKKQNDDKMDTFAQDVSEVMKNNMNFMNALMFSKNKQ
jgi:hypothetical protein